MYKRFNYAKKQYPMQIICVRCLDCIICSTFHIPTNKLLKHKFSFIFLSAKFFKRFLQGKLFFQNENANPIFVVFKVCVVSRTFS